MLDGATDSRERIPLPATWDGGRAGIGGAW